jgi:hypothetical protein
LTGLLLAFIGANLIRKTFVVEIPGLMTVPPQIKHCAFSIRLGWEWGGSLLCIFCDEGIMMKIKNQ